MNRRKWVMSLFFAVATTLFLAGCGQSSPSGQDGLPPTETPPVTPAEIHPDENLKSLIVGDVHISAAEFEYYIYLYYYQLLEYYGRFIDITEIMDYIEEEAALWLQYIVILSEQAKKEGAALTDEDAARIERQIKETDESMLQQDYGAGITLEKYRSILERQQLAVRFEIGMVDSFDRSEAALERYYIQNKQLYDIVDYNILSVEPERRAEAEEILSRVTVSGAFEDLYHEYLDDSSHTDCGGHSHFTDAAADIAYYLPENAAAYLLAGERKPGDKAIVEDDGLLCVILFNERRRDETVACDVRHILIQVEDHDSAEDARARAEEILQLWKNGAADESYFAELAGEHTTDHSSAATGGLYAGITPASGYMEPFRDWAVDPSRNPGDTGIVEVDGWYHGFHIMYFSGHSLPAWMLMVKEDMDQAEYGEWFGLHIEAYPYTIVSGE